MAMDGTATTPQKEVELKLELPPGSLPALMKVPLLKPFKARRRRTNEVSVYFDTDRRKLRRNGVLLRVRRVGGRHVQTIKAAGGSTPFERDEWEAEIAGEQPDLTFAADSALAPLVSDKLRRRLKPQFETRVQRTLYPIADGSRAIAFTVDRGTIHTGKRSAPLCEIELELERGSPAQLFELARDLVGKLPAQLAVRSKAERGYALMDGEEEAPVKAVPFVLGKDASAREAFHVIGRACLKQVVSNEPALLKGESEGVHQMRVGLRRLRAAISLFRGLLDDPQTEAIKAELKWLTGELGPARELDVLMRRVVAPLAQQQARWQGMPALSHALSEGRAAAIARAQEAVRSARFRALTLDLAAWLEAGHWRAPDDELVRNRGEVAAAAAAAGELRRRWRKVRKKGKELAKLDARSRHKLRIQAKKLRYAVEFFASLFAGRRAAKRRRRFAAALERLQDGLGDLNDIAVHEQRMAAIGQRRRRTSAGRAFAAGLLAGREDARTEGALAAATEAFEDLAAAKPFWR
jgi:triphosphatase